jgi:hypothetical protein
MNDLYNETIERNGRVYRYDPDADCFYRVPVKLSTFDRYSWIVCVILLSVVCVYVEYFIK